MRKSRWLVAGAWFLWLLFAAPAGLAHGDLQSAQPRPGSRLAAPPRQLVLTFTEPPTKEGILNIKDGCGTDAIESARVLGRSIKAQLMSDAHGRWKVRYRVISDVDGHVTRGKFSFTVRGKSNCAAREEDKDQTQADKSDEQEGFAGDESSGREGSMPWLPIVLGSVGVLGAALLIRKLTG